MSVDVRAQLAEMLRGRSRQELQQALVEAEQQSLREAEEAKQHPLSEVSLSAPGWDQFKLHMLDGGGVSDPGDLSRRIWEALLADDQKTFWHLMPHFLKSWAKVQGCVSPTANGGVIVNGAGVLTHSGLKGEVK